MGTNNKHRNQKMTDFQLTELEEKQIEEQLAKLEPPIPKRDYTRCVVVIDGLPIAPASKLEKLSKVIRKKLTEVGPLGETGLNLITDDDGATVGYGFAEYETPDFATRAVRQLNNLKLDKQHTLLFNLFSDFEKLENLKEEYEEPKDIELPKIENMRQWLEDPRAVDQYVIRFGDRTEIYWNEQKGAQKAELEYGRDNWTESWVAWSPLGTYLTTIHRQGVALWGGPSWSRIVRFQHPAVEVVEFSPQENYLVTFSPQFVEKDNAKDPKAVIVWDVRTGRKLRGFINGKSPFRWSPDDRFVARLGEDVVSVYETPHMGLHQKQSLKVPGVVDFAWSPSQNVLAYFVPEQGTRAARVALVEFPSRKVIRQKNLFNVADAKLHWQKDGRFLCVKVDRTSKSKKTIFTNFELFRMKEKEIPIDVLEMKDRIVAFAWEPKGKRFCVIHGEGSRADISFYEMKKKGVKFIVKLEKKPANSIFWSPRGRHVVLAGMRNLNGQLEFYDVEAKESMAVDEHFMASSVEWDPTGRFVVTSVSAWRQKLETGMNLYTFHGQKVHSVLRDMFYQLVWRPRPPSLLSHTTEQHIQANLDEYIEGIKESDAHEADAVKIADRKKRADQIAAFAAKVEAALKAYQAAKDKRIAVYGFDPDAPLPADQLEKTEAIVEEVLEVKKEVL